MSTCCPPTPCCIGTVTKAPNDVLPVEIDMAEWVAAGYTPVTGTATVSVYDVTNDTTAPAPPSGVGVVTGSIRLGRGPDGQNSLFLFSVEGGSDGVTYRLDWTVEFRDCDGNLIRKTFCVTVQVAEWA